MQNVLIYLKFILTCTHIHRCIHKLIYIYIYIYIYTVIFKQNMSLYI